MFLTCRGCSKLFLTYPSRSAEWCSLACKKKWRIDNKSDLSGERLRELLYYSSQKTGNFYWKSVPKHRSGRIKSGDIAGYSGNKGYWFITVDGEEYAAHRLAWLYMTNKWPKGQIDHKNLQKSDNRWGNLREASNGQNQANRPRYSRNKSGYKGVCFNVKQRKYIAQISHKGTITYLGAFDNAKEAHKAYCRAAKKKHKEFFNPG